MVFISHLCKGYSPLLLRLMCLWFRFWGIQTCAFATLAKTDEKSSHVGIRLDTHEMGRNKDFQQR